MSDNETQLQGVLGMLRGVDEMVGGTDTWGAAELRKISSKLKAISATVDQKVVALKEAPKQPMSYDALVTTITEMIRQAESPRDITARKILKNLEHTFGKEAVRGRGARKRWMSDQIVKVVEAEKEAGRFPEPKSGGDEDSSSDESDEDDFDEDFASINDLFKQQKISKALLGGKAESRLGRSTLPSAALEDQSGIVVASQLQKKMYEVKNKSLPNSQGKDRKKEKKMQVMVGTMGLQIFKKGSGRLSATFLYQHLRTWNAKLDGLMIVTMDGQEHFFYTDQAPEIGVAMRDEAMKIREAIQAGKNLEKLGDPVWEEDDTSPDLGRFRVTLKREKTGFGLGVSDSGHVVSISVGSRAEQVEVPVPSRIIMVDGQRVKNKKQIGAVLGTAGTTVEFVFLAQAPTSAI